MVLAKARIVAGGFTLFLPVNPYSAQWDYQENTMSYDTIGGRVVQLLSVQIGGVSVTSVAGSRSELQRVAEGVRTVMDYHIKTSRPASFRVPSRAWDFLVYLQAMPQVGWDVAATTYPYQLQMAVEDDIGGLQTHKITTNALTRLAENIGYKKAFHGGEAAGFQKVVSTLLANSTPVTSGGGGGGAGGGGPNGGPGSSSSWQGKGKWEPKIANAQWTGATIKDQIFNCWSAVFGSKSGNDALCIAERESGFQPTANNHYGSNPVHYVYGLFQISDVHSASSWFPSSGIHGTQGGLLYNAEYNTRSAMQIYQQEGWGPWSTAGGCGL